jgi:hypothetical protein
MEKIIFAAALLAAAAFNSNIGYCQQEKGDLLAAGEYFTVYGDNGIEVYSVIDKLKFEYLVYSANFGEKYGQELDDILAKTIDGLYMEVSDILDIHVYSFKGIIIIMPDKGSLAAKMKSLFGIDFNERSIYYHEKSVIYISLADMTAGMLGHEMAHAVISNFFVVPVPVKVQEVLAGFVEYNLLKKRQALSN